MTSKNLKTKVKNEHIIDPNSPTQPVKPFLRWAGGKQNLVKQISSLLPIERFNVYYEPFLGAGSLFFYNNFKKNVLSDINPHLINSYLSIRDSPEEVFNLLQDYKKKLSKEYYYKLRKKFNINRNKLDNEQASIFIFLIHTSFNGIYRVNKKGEYNVPFGKPKPALPDIVHLKLIAKKLEKSEIINCMFEDIIDKISQNDFVYFDPPYPPINTTSFFQHYTIDKFPENQQIELSEKAKHLSNKGAFVMISNAETNLINNLYRNWNIRKLKTYRYINCKSERQIVNELIITNY